MNEFKVGDWVRHEKYGIGRIYSAGSGYWGVQYFEFEKLNQSQHEPLIFEKLTKLYLKFDNFEDLFEEEEESKPHPKFKVGEKVVYTWGDNKEHSSSFTIIKIESYSDGRGHVYYLYYLDYKSLVAYEEMLSECIDEPKVKPKFEVGERVVCFPTNHPRFIGEVREIIGYNYLIKGSRWPGLFIEEKLKKLNDPEILGVGDKVKILSDELCLKKGGIFKIVEKTGCLMNLKFEDKHRFIITNMSCQDLELVLD